jgi:hypothetical protein
VRRDAVEAGECSWLLNTQQMRERVKSSIEDSTASPRDGCKSRDGSAPLLSAVFAAMRWQNAPVQHQYLKPAIVLVRGSGGQGGRLCASKKTGQVRCNAFTSTLPLPAIAVISEQRS